MRKMADSKITMLILVGLIAGAIGLFGFFIWYGSDQDVNVNYGEGQSTLIPKGLSEKGIIFNNTELQDSTSFNSATNTCTASRLGMNIVISPCVANDVDLRDIKQLVNFTWSGGSPQRTDWVFVYDGQLESGSMNAWLNTSRVRQDNVKGLQLVNNFQVTGVQSSSNLGQPDARCQIGSINNTQMYNVTRNTNSTTLSKVYCFTNVSVVNASTYSVSGNIDVYNLVNVTYNEPHWVDVTSNIEYMGFGLLQDNRSYYKVSNVTFNPGQTISTLWSYTPNNRTGVGKWHILGYDGNTGLINSIVNNQYIYIDPWWNSAIPYRQVLNFTTGDAINTNYTHRVRVPYQAEFGSGCADMYVVYKDSLEIDADYRICNASLVELGFRNQNATAANTLDTNYSIYYGASAGTHKTDRNVVYVWNDDFGDGSINSTKYSSNVGGCDSFTGGVCTLPIAAGGDGYYLLSNIIFNVNTTFEANMSFEGTGGSGQQRYFGFQPVSARISAGGSPYAALGGNEVTGVTTDTGQTTGLSNTAFHYFALYRNSTVNIQGYQDNSSSAFSPFSISRSYLNDTSLPVGSQMANSGAQKIDFWRAFGDVSSRPNYTFSGQQVTFGMSVVLDSPIDGFVTSSYQLNLTGNVTAVGSTIIANVTAKVFNSTNSLVFNKTNLTISGLTQANLTFNTTSLTNGTFTWFFDARATDNSQVLSSNRTFIIDQSIPVVNLTIVTPFVVTDTFPTNISIFLNATDPSLQSCFYDYGTGNITAPSCNANINLSVSNFGVYTIRGYANDSVGNFAVNTSNASVIYYNETQSSNIVAEGGYVVFNLTVNFTDIPTTTALFRYNNTLYTPGTQTTSQNGTFFSYTLNIPAGAGNATGIRQFWNWTVNMTGMTNFTTKTYNQTVLGVVFSDCSTGGVLIMNFTHYDEGSRLQFNSSLGNNLQLDLALSSLIDPSIVFTYNNTKINSPSLLVCVPSGVLNSTSYRVDLTGSYIGTGLVQEFYYVDNGTLSLSNIPQNVSWYDLNLNDSTTFLFTFLDEQGLQVPGIIVHTLRDYIGAAQFLEVERSKADNNGQTHLHLVQEDVIYKFNISLNNRQIFLSDKYNAKCLSSPCSITLSAEPDNDEFTTVFNNLPEGSYRLAVNKTSRQIILYFNLNETALMNLTIFSSDNNEEVVIANGSTTASAGQIVLTVLTNYGNQTYFATVYKDNRLVTTEVVDLTQKASDYFGTMGLFLAALAITCLALIGTSQGEWVVVWTAAGVLTVSLLYLVNLPWYALMTFVLACGIFIMKLVTRRRLQ